MSDLSTLTGYSHKPPVSNAPVAATKSTNSYYPPDDDDFYSDDDYGDGSEFDSVAPVTNGDCPVDPTNDVNNEPMKHSTSPPTEGTKAQDHQNGAPNPSGREESGEFEKIQSSQETSYQFAALSVLSETNSVVVPNDWDENSDFDGGSMSPISLELDTGRSDTGACSMAPLNGKAFGTHGAHSAAASTCCLSDEEPEEYPAKRLQSPLKRFRTFGMGVKAEPEPPMDDWPPVLDPYMEEGQSGVQDNNLEHQPANGATSNAEGAEDHIDKQPHNYFAGSSYDSIKPRNFRPAGSILNRFRSLHSTKVHPPMDDWPPVLHPYLEEEQSDIQANDATPNAECSDDKQPQNNNDKTFFESNRPKESRPVGDVLKRFSSRPCSNWDIPMEEDLPPVLEPYLETSQPNVQANYATCNAERDDDKQPQNSLSGACLSSRPSESRKIPNTLKRFRSLGSGTKVEPPMDDWVPFADTWSEGSSHESDNWKTYSSPVPYADGPFMNSRPVAQQSETSLSDISLRSHGNDDAPAKPAHDVKKPNESTPNKTRLSIADIADASSSEPQNSQKKRKAADIESISQDVQPQISLGDLKNSQTQTTTDLASIAEIEPKPSIDSEAERPRKRARTTPENGGRGIAGYAATALAGAVAGSVGTVVLLASLPPNLFY